MTIEEMKAEIITDLTTELMVTDGDLFNLPLLTSKVNNAVREVISARNYPDSYTNSMIEKDAVKYYAQVRNLALYDYNQSGAEGQTTFSGDGNSIQYVSRDSMFAQINPLAVIT